MLNGDFARQQATALASRLQREFPGDVAGQVQRALRIALAGPVGADKVERGLRLIRSLETRHGVTAAKAFEYYCLMVLNLNEFVYLD
jgi:hypothetical protein